VVGMTASRKTVPVFFQKVPNFLRCLMAIGKSSSYHSSVKDGYGLSYTSLPRLRCIFCCVIIRNQIL